MKQPYVVALIFKDAVESLPKVVPAHEVPVLVAVHGQDRVTVDEGADLPAGLTEAEFEDDDALELEYVRLEQAYGESQKTGQHFVANAYGGLAGFKAAMHDSAGEAPAPRRGRPPKAKD